MFKKSLITGILLFGMFFGAGNLIFPPALGVLSGQHFLSAIVGFIVSGVGLAVLTLVIGMLNEKGYVDAIALKMSPTFALVFLVILYATFGPFSAIPRTSAIAFEVGISPMLSSGGGRSLALFLYTLVYYGLAYALVLYPSKIVDIVGKVLTPLFALMISLLVILGMESFGDNVPHSALEAYEQHRAFGTGFLEGFNTLDMLIAVAFSDVAIRTVKRLGFQNRKEYVSIMMLVGVVVAVTFSILYFGLGYLGNHFPVTEAMLASNVNKGVYVITKASETLFGVNSRMFLALMVSVTCFTTTTGLIMAVSEFFHEHFSRVSYKQFVAIFSVFGCLFANLGLNKILSLSLPILQILNPMTITLVMIIVVNKWIPLSAIGARLSIVIVTLITILMTVTQHWGLHDLEEMLRWLPLYRYSVPWLIPAVVTLLFAMIPEEKFKKGMIS